MKTKFLTNFSQIIDNYKYFIFDCDGVIWLHGKIFKEAVNSLNILHRKGKHVFFLSNKNRITKLELFNQLKDSGVHDTDINNVYPSSYLTGKYIKDNYPHVKKIYIIGRESLKRQLEEFGFDIAGGPDDDDKIIHLSEIKHLNIDHKIEALVCGSDDKINFYKLVYASNIASNTKLFFGTNYDNNSKYGKILIPAAYSYITSIETTSETKAKIVAKPNKEILSVLLNRFDQTGKNEVMRQTLMIGDSLRTDIQFANNCGIDSLLVLTGVSEISNVKNIMNSDIALNDCKEFNMPTFCVNDLNIEKIQIYIGNRTQILNSIY